jgi:hypothetical protein
METSKLQWKGKGASARRRFTDRPQPAGCQFAGSLNDAPSLTRLAIPFLERLE